jgi:hypothetical protein
MNPLMHGLVFVVLVAAGVYAAVQGDLIPLAILGAVAVEVAGYTAVTSRRRRR